jgi:hypothetical protein
LIYLFCHEARQHRTTVRKAADLSDASAQESSPAAPCAKNMSYRHAWLLVIP